jgi:hypothetical protein
MAIHVLCLKGLTGNQPMVSRKPIAEAANASGHLTPEKLVKALALASLVLFVFIELYFFKIS